MINALDMKPSQFIVTDDPVAVGVLVFLSFIFVAWLILLIVECFRLRGNKKEIRNSESAGVLEDVLKRQIVLRRTEGSSIDPEQQISAERQEAANFESALEDFRATVGAGSERSILAT